MILVDTIKEKKKFYKTIKATIELSQDFEFF